MGLKAHYHQPTGKAIMSEFTATIYAHYDNPDKRQELEELLQNQTVIQIDDEAFQIQHVDLGPLVSFTLFSGGFGLDKPVLKWMAGLGAQCLTVEFFADELDKSVAMMGGKRKSMSVVVKEMAKVSNTFAAGLAFRAGPRKILDYLKNNPVDLYEEFQGERHIDHLYWEYDDQYPQIFQYLADNRLITDDLLVTDGGRSKVPNTRAIHSLRVPTAIKLYRDGQHPEIFHESDNNILKEFHFHNDSLEDLTYIFERLAEVPYDSQAHGIDLITELFQDLNFPEKITRAKELEYVEKIKVIMAFKDNIKFIDAMANQLLTQAKGFKHIGAYLKSTLPSLIENN
jgi:hypothetical protein